MVISKLLLVCFLLKFREAPLALFKDYRVILWEWARYCIKNHKKSIFFMAIFVVSKAFDTVFRYIFKILLLFAEVTYRKLQKNYYIHLLSIWNYCENNRSKKTTNELFFVYFYQSRKLNYCILEYFRGS